MGWAPNWEVNNRETTWGIPEQWTVKSMPAIVQATPPCWLLVHPIEDLFGNNSERRQIMPRPCHATMCHATQWQQQKVLPCPVSYLGSTGRA